MRKSDYAFLAASIKQRLDTAISSCDAFPLGSPNAQYWRGQRGALSALAYDFAQRASVDHDAFLKACGLEP